MLNNYQNNINAALKELSATKSISSALSVCNTLLEYMGVATKNVEDIELSKLKLPNAERYDRWFEAHPHFRGDRACFQLTPNEASLEAKFYAIQKRSKLFIAGSVNFTPNFEDRDYTRTDPNTKVGIDFFLTPEKDSVIVALSNKGNLRLVELSERLTNTQNEIFTIWHDVALTIDRNALHTTIWESFKLSSLNKKFYEGIANSFTSLTQHLHQNGVEEQLANQFANRLHGRLLFLWFLRKKNIINESKDYFTLGDQGDDEYYENTLSALFFNVLNNEDHKDFDPVTPYLNGGLFDQKSDGEYWNNHKPSFPTGFFKVLYDHFDSFNFTTDESTPEYEQIAIDPEMLGRIFESFLATLKTETGAQAKKANGAFYTPREIVSYMCRESLRQYLYTALDASVTLKGSIDDLLDRSDSEWALAGTNSKRDSVAKEDRVRIMDALREIRVLDPAVGSGAFPMGILHKILSLFERLEPNFDSYEKKLAILRNNIYGVDIDPTAIEISRLRAWLSIIVDVKDIKKIKPLPNLDFKFVCANSLVGLEKSHASFTTDENLKPELIRIRDEYYATSSKTKKEKLQREYTKLTHKESLFDTEETRQLKSYKPFENGKSASFYDPELMHGLEVFDVVIGNPPYLRIQGLQKTQPHMVASYRNNYKSAKGSFDLYAVFIEKGFNLLNPKGGLSFIVPHKFFQASFGRELRKILTSRKALYQIIKFGSEQVFEDPTTYTCLLFLSAQHNESFKYVDVVSTRNLNETMGAISENRVTADAIASELPSPTHTEWSFQAGNVSKVLKTLSRQPQKLGDITEKIFQGIATSSDKIYVLRIVEVRQETVRLFSVSLQKEVEIEKGLLRPFLMGKDVHRYETPSLKNYVIFPYREINGKMTLMGREYIQKEFPLGWSYLLQNKKGLEDREGGRMKQDGFYAYIYPKNLNLYHLPKIMTPEIALGSQMTFDDHGLAHTTKVYSFVFQKNLPEDLKYWLGLLNSKILWYFLSNTGYVLRGGYFTFKTNYLAPFPIKRINFDNKEEKEMHDQVVDYVDKVLAEKKSNHKSLTHDIEAKIDALIYKLYGLNEEEIRLIEESR